VDVFDSAVELQTLEPPPPALSLVLFARPPPLLDGKFAAAIGSNAEL